MNLGMRKRMERYIGTDTLISVYTDANEPDKYTLGFLLQIDDHYLLMNKVNRFGEEDGFCIISIDVIFAYDDDKLYSGKIKKLLSLKNQLRKEIRELDHSVMISLVKYAKDNHFLIEINEDNSYIGFVTYYSEEIVELELIDIYAKKIGTACVDTENISMIACQEKYFKDIELLLQLDSN